MDPSFAAGPGRSLAQGGCEMPKGWVVYVPSTVPGRVSYQGFEIPARAEDVAEDARDPGTRVRFELAWDGDDVRAWNVRRVHRARFATGARGPRVPSRRGPPVLLDGARMRTVEGGSER